MLPRDEMDAERSALLAALSELQGQPAIPPGSLEDVEQDAPPSIVPKATAPTRGPLPQSAGSSSAADRQAMLLDTSGGVDYPQEEPAQPQPAPYEVPRIAERPDQSDEMPMDFRRGLLSFAGGDVGAYDRRKAAWDNRDFTRQDQELDLETKRLGITGKRGEFEDKQAQRLQARALLDPNSPQSREAQQMFRADAERYASLGIGGIADQARQAAAGIEGKSAAQIAKLKTSFDTYFGNLIKASEFGRKAEHDDVETQRKIEHDKLTAELRREGIEASKANAMAMRMLAGARFQETKEENKRRQDDRETNRSEKEAEAYGKDIAPLNEAEILAGQAEEMKKKANTGKVANFIQEKIRKPLGFPDKELLDLEAQQGLVNAAIRKAEAGLSLTASERELLRQTTPEQDMDDEEYARKQKGRLDQIRIKKEEIKKKHPKSSGVGVPGNLEQKERADKARRALASDSGASDKAKAGAREYLRSIGQL
jgi:hypothetical protein